jgi:hypothetical protein
VITVASPPRVKVSDAVWMALITAVATLLTLLLKMAFRAYVAHRREHAETDEARRAWGEADDLDEGKKSK